MEWLLYEGSASWSLRRCSLLYALTWRPTISGSYSRIVSAIFHFLVDQGCSPSKEASVDCLSGTWFKSKRTLNVMIFNVVILLREIVYYSSLVCVKRQNRQRWRHFAENKLNDVMIYSAFAAQEKSSFNHKKVLFDQSHLFFYLLSISREHCWYPVGIS